jgi:predicted permease
VSGVGRDLTHALRQLRRQPGFAVVVAVTLALGFGANTALFSVADAVLLRPLPVEDPSALVLFQWTSGPSPAVEYLTGEWWQEAGSGRVTSSSFSYPAFEAFGEPPTTLAATFAWAELRRASLSVGGRTDLAVGQVVSGGYYSGLGVPALLGRTITPEDDRVGADMVAVLGHGYWQRRFGGDAGVIGQTGMLDGRPFTIVGVTPSGFSGTLPLGQAADVSVPLRAGRAPGEPYLTNPAWHWLQVMGRLRPGATAAQAEAEMAPRLASASAARGGDAPRLRLTDGSQGLTRRRDEARPPLVVLAAMTGLVLLMACATVAGLLLARGAARRREIGVRLALGAGRWRIVRQLLAESAVLGALGALLGVAVAWEAKDVLVAGLMPDGTPEVALDGRALALLAAVSLATAVLTGLVPALRATRADLVRDLREGGGAGVRLGLGRALVVAQVAVSLVLLVGAGLLLRTLRNLVGVETGVAAEGVHLFKVHAVTSSPAESLALSRRLLERFQALPGVRDAGVSTHQLLADRTDRTRISIAGRPPDPAGGAEYAHVNRVGGGFFAAQGISLRAGRGIGPQDDVGTPPVVVINEAFARAYFPGQDPLGRRVNGAEVVGVAADTRYGALRDPAPPSLFVPAFQQAAGSFSFQVRSGTAPAALAPLLREAVREVAPTAALHELTTPRQQVAASVTRERLMAGLTSFFGAVTLLLASLGLYGLMAYAMGRRTREIGVRMTLGARPADVRRMALRGGLRLVLAGAALGVVGALALARLTASVLYGVTPSDPPTVAAALLVLGAVTLVACWLPARRAARVDPAAALRCE